MKICCPECGHNFNLQARENGLQTRCPACGEYTIIDLSSMNKRVCASCRAEFDWNLKPNQKSTLIGGLKGDNHE